MLSDESAPPDADNRVAVTFPWTTPIRWREGFVVLNGAMVKADDFPALFAIFGHTFGGRGRTFRLPKGGSPVSETLTSTDGARAAFYDPSERRAQSAAGRGPGLFVCSVNER
jgi:hypothetical protein